jgi:hypothetical protein
MPEGRCSVTAGERSPGRGQTGGATLADTMRFLPALGGSGSGSNCLNPAQRMCLTTALSALAKASAV